MTLLEAYDLVLTEAKKFKGVVITPIEKSDDEDLNKSDLPVELWGHISIPDPGDDTLWELESKLLQEHGISFDTGWGGGFRDWEIDWSFSVK